MMHVEEPYGAFTRVGISELAHMDVVTTVSDICSCYQTFGAKTSL